MSIPGPADEKSKVYLPYIDSLCQESSNSGK